MTFKKVEGGWLFREPNPNLLGSARHYLLDDAQKQQVSDIVDVSNSTRVGLRAGLYLGLAVVAWVFAVAGVLWALGIDAESASGPLSAVVYAIMLLPLAAILPAVAVVQQRRLRPILEHARPTDQRITWGDLRELQRSAPPISRRQAIGLASLTATTALLLSIAIVLRGRFGDATSCVMLIGVVSSLAATIAHIVRARAAHGST